ncbi:inhibitor of nuclear factor kappa-B kinase subunit alpha-like isoform X2 [Pseudomyrmex gracilis]|uniref:inhibitor of nuclear factor kappa-B kinase subunit alpha-like isoform X2 n=2 Tax=Pseudomyrmex gracilis TaxID=219809 RepID=UPI0009952554|nr:inhibitor of nuclear factor kappa-B kinase subunit alpha-like isoform X2 [Pseudomyrmex gracilis]
MSTIVELSQSSDTWKLHRVLGTGGFGVVELWVHIQSDKKLAIKKCRWDFSALTSVQQKRWSNEIDIMKRLKHPNIVKTELLPFELSSVEKDLPILCMEYCKKGNLRKILNQPENCCGIDEPEAIKIMTEISSAVEYLHSYNITHRDLKPENIVLQEENNVISYKLIDLGYAKELGEASTSASLVGTLNYIAPELLWGEKYSCSVDYWSLGILFYELITGTRPFLPTMQHTMEWMKYIRNKSYDDIRAYKSEGKIIFRKDIPDPTQLSNYLRKSMVQWFRLVLQWDSHKRGRIFNNLMVFTMLQQIIMNKILYVFCVPFYKIYTYEINSSTTIKDLQLLIQESTTIEVEHQILTDYNGTVVNESTVTLASQPNDHILFLFRNKHLTKDIPTLHISTEVEKMITQSKTELNYEEVKDYYRHTIYFVKKEVTLFQLYIFALNINVDLLQKKIDMFNANLEEMLRKTKTLTDRVYANTGIKYMKKTNLEDTTCKTQMRMDKIDKLNGAVNQVKMEFMSLNRDNDKLRYNIQSFDFIKDLSEIYNKMCDMYSEFQKESFHKTAKSVDMVKLIFAFLRSREKQLRNKAIINITSQIDELYNRLSKLEKVLHSIIFMTKLYSKEYECYWKEHIERKITLLNDDSQFNNQQVFNLPSTNLDNVIQLENNEIYDNLVIRYKLGNLVTKMQKKYIEVISLDL